MGAFDEVVLNWIHEPRYDRFFVEREDVGDHEFDKILFQDHIGRHDSKGRMKDERDTNMIQSGMLGAPLRAKWSWARLVIEDWCHPDDVRRFLLNTKFNLTIGRDWIWSRKSLTAFEPIITVDAGLKKGEVIEADLSAFQKFAHGGEVVFWPWLEDSFEEIEVSSLDSFQVRLQGTISYLRGPIIGKVMLGPWLYRHPRKPQAGSGSLDDIDFEGQEENQEEL